MATESMNTLTFFQELYGDAAGWLTLWTPDRRTTWFQLPEQITDAATFSPPTDTYFGVGLGNERRGGRLTADIINTIPGLWMDVDLATESRPNLPKTADDAAELYPVPPTITVSSGRGVHVYWLFREPWVFDGDDHEKAAALLQGFQSTIRQAAADRGWKLDSTHDLSRILRVPGSKNYKSDPPTDVRVISSTGERYNPDDLEQFTASVAPRESRASKFQRNPGDGPAQRVIDNCVFMQAIRDNAASVSEPQWVAALSNLARCSDGEEACHAISSGYPGYTYDETARKIQHVLDDMHPATCSYIRDTLGFNQCTDCGVKAPVAFALRRRADNPIPDGFFDTETGPSGISKFTDLGNAEYFAQYYAGKVKHCAEMDKWLVWDGRRWAVDGSAQITVMAGKCVRSMYDFLSSMEPPQRTPLYKHATKSEDANKLSNMIKLARGMMSVSVDALDQDPWLLNTPTGIIDLRDGSLYKHDPSKNMTKLINAEYDPGATCPTFERFIKSTFDANTNVIGFVQRFLGYCLTGITREQQFVIAWGSGRNGKGTLLNLITDILADYAKTTPTEVLYAKKFDKPSNDIARLNGARFVLASEGERGKRLDEPLVKKMTGQDVLAARFLYKETFEFMPQFKIILMTNDKPSASEDDAALWARIQLVPFTRKFEGAEQDKNLKEKLSRETPGILNWLITGCLEWQRIGLAPPEEVLHATREYRGENDKLKAWIDECCTVDPLGISNSKDLYKSFQAWHLGNGEKFIMVYKNFAATLVKKGFDKFIGGGNLLKVRGLVINPQDETGLTNYKEPEQPF